MAERQPKIGNVEVNKQDGSYSFTNENGKYSYDSKGQLVEAPAGGNGQTKSFTTMRMDK